MSNWYMMNFQDSNSHMMTLIIYFHDFILVILFMIMIFIFYIMIWFLKNKYINLNVSHNHILEIIWTIIPMIILIFIAIPSLKILYMLEEIINPFLTLKITGRQWYWIYEYVDMFFEKNNNFKFDDFMIESLMLKNSNFRLLDTEYGFVVPFNIPIRLLINSVDVIHSWTIPSLGLKVDAIPGRINQIMINLIRPGQYFGQCSEICGVNHSFMPIKLESVSKQMFFFWLNNMKLN